MNTDLALLASGLFALSAPLSAQGTITAGNTSYTVGTISATQSDSITAMFSGNPASDTNVLFEHWYYYRVDGDTDENAFKNDVSLTQSYVGSHADLDWPDVDSRGLISAMLDLDVVALSADSGFLFAQMTITNISPNVLTLSFFTYADIDICTFAGNTATGTGPVQLVTGTCPAGDQVEFSGVNVDHWCVSTFDATECGIVDGLPTTLPDTGLPFGPGDYVGALQWADRPLNPGESITFVSKLDHNPNPCTTEASTSNYGPPLGGAGGPPSFVTTSLPEFGRTGTLQIGNTPANAGGSLLFGFQRASTRFGNVTVLVQSVDSLPLMTGGAGTATLSVPIPARAAAPGLCGAAVDFQFLYVDPTVQGQFQVGHTNGLEWIIGS